MLCDDLEEWDQGGEVEMQGSEGGPQGRGYMYACD